MTSETMNDNFYENINEIIPIKPYYLLSGFNKPNPRINEISREQYSIEYNDKYQLNKNIQNAINTKKEIEDEIKKNNQSIDILNELNVIKKNLYDYDKDINNSKKEIETLKINLNSIELELLNNKESIINLLDNEEYKSIKKSYDDAKIDYENCIIPTILDTSNKKMSKSDIKKYNEEREKVLLKKNQLSNNLRNREINLQNAEQSQNKKLTQIEVDKINLQNKIQEKEIEFNKKIENIVLLKNQHKKYQILLAKLDICDTNIEKAINDKNEYELRGMSIITKKSIIDSGYNRTVINITDYDNNGKITNKFCNKNLMNKELKELEANPPMKEYIETSKILNNNKWVDIDYHLLNQMKQNIYNKYNYDYDDENNIVKSTYTMDEYIKSL